MTLAFYLHVLTTEQVILFMIHLYFFFNCQSLWRKKSHLERFFPHHIGKKDLILILCFIALFGLFEFTRLGSNLLWLFFFDAYLLLINCACKIWTWQLHTLACIPRIPKFICKSPSWQTQTICKLISFRLSYFVSLYYWVSTLTQVQTILRIWVVLRLRCNTLRAK